MQSRVNTNVLFKTHRIFLVDDKEKLEITTPHLPIYKVYSQVNIIIQSNGSITDITNSLPENYKNAIYNVVLNRRLFPSEYCCIDFAKDALGIYSEETINESGDWDVSEFEEKSLNPGDAIVITGANQELLHYAIYLTNGIYLSIFGSVSPITASNLEETMKAYNGVNAYKKNSIMIDGKQVS